MLSSMEFLAISMYIVISSSTSKPERWMAAAAPSMENMALITSSPFSMVGFLLVMLHLLHLQARES